MSEKEARRQPRTQFTIKRLLLLVLVAAIGIVVWQRYIYEHPAHKNPSYEKAPYTKSGQAQIGPNKLVVTSISRSDRDGSLVIQDRKGNPITRKIPNETVLKSSGSWLDTVQLELSVEPGDIEILELRVFDSESRASITTDDRFGYRIVDSNTIHLYGLGAKLPDHVDVWMRLLSRKPNDTIVKLAPSEGASCKVHGGKLALAQMVEGNANFEKDRFVVYREDANDCTLLVEYDGPDWPRGTRYQFTTVKKDGRRIPLDALISSTSFYQSRKVIPWVSSGISEVDHFEIRPFVERDRFFFEGISLPKTSPAKFTAPPKAKFTFSGQTKSVELTELAPLSMRLSSLPGGYASGVGTRHGIRWLERDPNADLIRQHGQSTIAFDFKGISGISNRRWNITLLDMNGKQWSNSLTGTSRSGGGWIFGFKESDLALDKIEAVELQLR